MSLYEETKTKVEEIQKKSAPLREEKEKLEKELAPKWAKVRELSQEIRKVEGPLAELAPVLNVLERQEQKRLKRERQQKEAEEKSKEEPEKVTLTKDDVGIVEAKEVQVPKHRRQ